jgi:predicted lipoprotein with Yx(FWY)xxD motif
MITHRKSGTNDRRRLQIAATSFAAAAFTLTAAACGSTPGDSAGSMPVPSATGDPVSAQATGLGTILVDGQGRTLYQFANDMNNKSTCTDTCAADWHYTPAPDSLPASLPGVTGTLGTTTRDDGHHQLTVAGHPLYTFVGDATPGQTNGQGINLNGGVWTVVSPAGAPLANPSPVGTAAQNPALPGY